MLFDSRQCPVELSEIAEAYVMNTLGRASAVAFEEHLLMCSRCVAAVEDADRYVRAVRVAAERLRTIAGRTAHS